MSTVMTPLVVDCYQGEEIKDWAEVYAFGIRGVIHKCSEGSNFRDKTYAVRRARALKAGLLWGAYHFMNDTDVETQVANFLAAAEPDAHTLLALDYEENKHRTGSLEQARRFLELVYAKTGQRPVLYSGNLIKEQLRKPDAFFNSHRLWLAHYSATPKLPAGWSKAWLHQYTGDGVGPEPHEVPGITTRGIDLNVFHGEDLDAEWAPLGPTISQPFAVAAGDEAPPATAAPAETDRDQEPAATGGWFDNWGFAKVNDLAEQGSRLAEHVRNMTAGIWKRRAVLGGGGTTAATVVAQSPTAMSWIEAHPFLTMGLLAGALFIAYEIWDQVQAYRIRRGLLSASEDGRYFPRGGTPQQTKPAKGS